MSCQSLSQTTIEPERYELFAEALYQFEPDRREFFKLLGGGLLVCLFLDESLAVQPPGRGSGRGGPLPQEIGAWLHIGEDGAINSPGVPEIEVGSLRRRAPGGTAWIKWNSRARSRTLSPADQGVS
jgi:hypothetical protein